MPISISTKKVPEDLSSLFDEMKDPMGRYRTESLFVERNTKLKYPSYFTLKRRDYKGHISMYRKYMEIADPTEYQVAIKLLGSWEHWLALNKSKWFKGEVAAWRAELKIKLESERYNEMIAVLENPSSTETAKIQATKWLATRYGEKSSTVTKRGRPSKEEVASLAKQLATEEDELSEDALRIGLV